MLFLDSEWLNSKNWQKKFLVKKKFFRIFWFWDPFFDHFGPKKPDFWVFDQKTPIPSKLSYFCLLILKTSAKSLERFSRKNDFSRFWPFFDRFWPKMANFWIFGQKPPIPSDLFYFCPFILKISAKSLVRFSRKIDFSRFWPFFDRFWPFWPFLDFLGKIGLCHFFCLILV